MINRIKSLFRPIDLTKGKPWKVILIFSLPILISFLFQQVYSITDIIIIGQNLDAASIAGVNDTSSLSFIFLQFALGCASGFSVVTANRFGNKDTNGVRKSIATQLIISLIISIIITILAIILIPYLLAWINVVPKGGIQTEVYNAAYLYLFIYFLGIIGQIYYNLCCSILRSVGDSLNPLLFLIFSTILNVVLDLLFIVVFKWGVAGAAIATVISQLLAAIISYIYTFVKYKEFRLTKEDFKISKKDIFEHLKLGLPLAFQFSILAIGLIVLQGAVVQFDEGIRVYAQQAYGASGKYASLLTTPFSVLGVAMLSYCGQNYGAKQLTRIKKGVNQALLISFIVYLIIMILALTTSINGAFLYFFLDSKYIVNETIDYATNYMYCTVPLYFILAALFILRNSLQGIKRPIFPFIAGVSELVGRILIALFLPTLINPINPISHESFIGLCFSDPMAWLLAVICLSYGAIKYIYLAKEIK